MGRKPDEQTDRRAEMAAYLVGSMRLPRADAARRMQTSLSNLSRLLKRAEKRRVFEQIVDVRFYPDALSRERLRELERIVQPSELERLLGRVRPANGVRVRHVHVIPGDGPESPGQPFSSAYLARFGQAASSRVLELLAHARTVALTWGKTLGSVVDGLAASAASPRNPPVKFVPLCAESEMNFGTMESSSSIAWRLNQIVNQGTGDRLSLTRIPAFIPPDWIVAGQIKTSPTASRRGGRTLDDVRAIALASSKAYVRIFGTTALTPEPTSDALVDQLDMLLTSVGHADHPAGFFYEELKESGKVKAGELKRLTVGDIGGILLARDEAAKRRVADLNRMWTGLQYDRLDALAIRASTSDPSTTPGVVVVSCGRTRGETVEAIVRRGLANELILDEDVANDLVTRLRKPVDDRR